MPITLAPYDPTWPARFREARADLVRALDAEWLVTVEHVGSTAVPGLSAKPIIDMLAGVRSLESVVSAGKALRSIGYVPWFGDSGRISYERRNQQGEPTHHAHFVGYALRRNPSHREAYERLKRDLAARYTDTRDYSEAKGPFIRSVLSAT